MRLLFRSCVPALLVLVGLFGCGPKAIPRAEVTGQVKTKGVSLPVGTISFVGLENNVVETGPIKDGKYTIARAPVGPVKISIITPAPPAAMQTKQKVEGKNLEGTIKIVPVPAKYNNPDKSGLTYTVTSDKTQTHDINLP